MGVICSLSFCKYRCIWVWIQVGGYKGGFIYDQNLFIFN